MQGEVLQVPCMWSSTKYKNRVSRQLCTRAVAHMLMDALIVHAC